MQRAHVPAIAEVAASAHPLLSQWRMGAVAELEVEDMIADLLAGEPAWARETSPARSCESAPDPDLSGLRDARGSLPLDSCVLVLTDVEPPDPMGLAAALVLFHVDGTMTVGQIAESAQMPLQEVVACVHELLAWGVVEIACEDTPCSIAPVSAVRRRAE
jgi:hypothetical protein